LNGLQVSQPDLCHILAQMLSGPGLQKPIYHRRDAGDWQHLDRECDPASVVGKKNWFPRLLEPAKTWNLENVHGVNTLYIRPMFPSKLFLEWP
jgi:hypothetical protein